MGINKTRVMFGLKPYVAAVRVCLSCQEEFNSWGIKNRICDKCKSKNEGIVDYSFDVGGLDNYIPIEIKDGVDFDEEKHYTYGEGEK